MTWWEMSIKHVPSSLIITAAKCICELYICIAHRCLPSYLAIPLCRSTIMRLILIKEISALQNVKLFCATTCTQAYFAATDTLFTEHRVYSAINYEETLRVDRITLQSAVSFI